MKLKNITNAFPDSNLLPISKLSLGNESKIKPFASMIKSIWFPYFKFVSLTNIFTIIQIVYYIISLNYHKAPNQIKLIGSLELLSPSQSALFNLGEKYPYFIVVEKQYYRLFTPILLHANIYHLLCSILSNFVISSYIEMLLGSKNYVILILISDFGGSLSSGIICDNPSVGGSFIAMTTFGCLGGIILFYSWIEEKKILKKDKIFERLKINKINIEFYFPLIFMGILNWIVILSSRNIDYFGGIACFFYGYWMGIIFGICDQRIFKRIYIRLFSKLLLVVFLIVETCFYFTKKHKMIENIL